MGRGAGPVLVLGQGDHKIEIGLMGVLASPERKGFSEDGCTLPGVGDTECRWPGLAPFQLHSTLGSHCGQGQSFLLWVGLFLWGNGGPFGFHGSYSGAGLFCFLLCRRRPLSV